MSRPAPLPLHCAEFGEGPPLLVLHGLFGSSANWRTLARRLAHQRRVLTLDLRNHGASPWAEEMSYPDLAADVAAFMHARGLACASLLGHSMGGKTAMVLALSRPRLVERLIVIDIAPVAYAHSHRDYIEAMRSLDATALARRAQADAALSAAVPDAGVRAFLLQNLVQRDGPVRALRGTRSVRSRRTLRLRPARAPRRDSQAVSPGGGHHRRCRRALAA